MIQSKKMTTEKSMKKEWKKQANTNKQINERDTREIKGETYIA